MADLDVAEKAVAALRDDRPTTRGSSLARGGRLGSIDASRILDDKLFARRQARRHAATPSRPSPATLDAAADNVDHRDRARTSPSADRDRARGRRALRHARELDHAHDASIIGALALLAALAPRPRASPATSAGACAPSRRAAEALAQGDVDHELSVRAATRSGAPPTPWPPWSSTCARWPAPPIASPPATSPSTCSRAPSATASAPPSPASWPSCAPP